MRAALPDQPRFAVVRFVPLRVRTAAFDRLYAIAWRTSAVNAAASSVSPSRRSIARRTLPSRLEVNRRGVLQRRAVREGELHHARVGLAGADDPGVRPGGHAAPLPLLDDRGVRALHQGADPGEGLPPPIGELGDARIDALARGRLAACRHGAIVGSRPPTGPRSAAGGQRPVASRPAIARRSSALRSSMSNGFAMR